MLLVPLAIALGPLATADEPIRARYQVDLVARSRAVFALPDGPRTIRAFRWVPEPGSTDAWRSARLRLIWDGDDPEAAGVDLPLGRFVAPDRGESPDRGEGYIRRMTMPYRRTGRIVLDAEGTIRGSIRLETDPGADALDGRGYLRAEILEAGEEPPRTSGEIREKGEGGAGAVVRYWYDRRPGPVAADPGR